ETRDGLLGHTLYEFGYDEHNLLISSTDAHGNVTLIDRDVDGTPLGITAPFGPTNLQGQTMALTLDEDGYLETVTNANNETWTIGYENNGGGLVTSFTKPRGNASTYVYDSLGRIEQVYDGESTDPRTWARTLDEV